MSPMVEFPCNGGEGSVVTADVCTEPGTDAGSAAGSDREVGVAKPLQQTNAKIVTVPNNSEATGPEAPSAPVKFSLPN